LTILKDSYQQSKQKLINQFCGAEEGIKRLEHFILDRPAAGHLIRTIDISETDKLLIYEKITFPAIYGTLIFPEGKVIVTYAVHKRTDTVIFIDIFLPGTDSAVEAEVNYFI